MPEEIKKIFDINYPNVINKIIPFINKSNKCIEDNSKYRNILEWWDC